MVDTHAFLWFIAGDQRLSSRARALIESYDNPLFFSAASLWEISIKASLGKLEFAEPLERLLPAQLLPTWAPGKTTLAIRGTDRGSPLRYLPRPTSTPRALG